MQWSSLAGMLLHLCNDDNRTAGSAVQIVPVPLAHYMEAQTAMRVKWYVSKVMVAWATVRQGGRDQINGNGLCMVVLNCCLKVLKVSHAHLLTGIASLKMQHVSCHQQRNAAAMTLLSDQEMLEALAQYYSI